MGEPMADPDFLLAWGESSCVLPIRISSTRGMRSIWVWNCGSLQELRNPEFRRKKSLPSDREVIS
jgi:hypothetical protein